VKRADELGIDAVAARQLDEELIPALEAAGLRSEAKEALKADDPHAAAQQAIADARGAYAKALSDANAKTGGRYAFSPEQIEGMNLRDLKQTARDATDAAKKGTPAPSRIRGQDPNATDTVETNVPDPQQTASTPTPMPEIPAAGKPRMTPQERFMATFPFSQDSSAPPAGGFQDTVAGPAGDFQATSTPGGGITQPFMADAGSPRPRTPPMVEIDAQIRGVKQPKQREAKPPRAQALEAIQLDPGAVQLNAGSPGSPADLGGGPIVVGSDFAPGRPAGVVDATQTRQPASPSVQRPQPRDLEKPAADGPKGPSLSETDPLLRAGAGAASAAKYVARNMWPTAIGAGAVLGGTAYGLGLFGGGRQQQPPQQQRGSAPAGPPVIVMPREAIQQFERSMQRPAPVQQQPPAPPQPARPGSQQSTDIIRQLSGRMA
jgi:hypothetical protein